MCDRRVGCQTHGMSVHDVSINTLAGEPASLGDHAGKTLLIVNVASRCGLTPQYTALQKIRDQYVDRGFEVLGFPCNQFGAQEPGTPDEIEEFCSTNYGVTFPLFEKIDVNGPGRHELYDELTRTADSEGHDGDIRWNFEKFLVAPDGRVVARYSPVVTPDDPTIVADIEANLPS
jgi:glutathione peroxidase